MLSAGYGLQLAGNDLFHHAAEIAAGRLCAAEHFDPLKLSDLGKCQQMILGLAAGAEDAESRRISARQCASAHRARSSRTHGCRPLRLNLGHTDSADDYAHERSVFHIEQDRYRS